MNKRHFTLHLQRIAKSEKGTSGILTLIESTSSGCQKLFVCETLEPPVPAFSDGIYFVGFAYNLKFMDKFPYWAFHHGCLPFISRDSNFQDMYYRGLFFQCGNTCNDTKGCILIGKNHDVDLFYLQDSEKTYELLMLYLENSVQEIILIVSELYLPY